MAVAMAVQEGISIASYYDIMVLGRTGSGKSTTVDKLLIANPTGQNYLGGQQNEIVSDKNLGIIKSDDISMWILSEQKDSEEERVGTRLKNLAFFRTIENPHLEVNEARDMDQDKTKDRACGMNVFRRTEECELFSNETSKVRILDVPGFFGADATAVADLGNSGVSLMRKVLEIQTAMTIKFRRILYFLPVRGELNRDDAILRLELKWMSHFFGKSIFKSMVLVATIPAYLSRQAGMPELPISEKEKSRRIFREVMNDVLQQAHANDHADDPPNAPPVIFISMAESCESILEKVKGALVENDEGLELEFDPNTCINCGMKTAVIKGEKVACYFPTGGMSEAIPYDESLCHPAIVPRFSTYLRNPFWFWRQVILKGEICVGCGKGPDSPGCMQVGKELKRMFRKPIKVDHNSKLTVHDDGDEHNVPEAAADHHENPGQYHNAPHVSIPADESEM